MSHRGHHASTAGTSTAEAQDWRTQAACWGDDPELWFPIGEPGSKAYERDAAIARSICADCPVVVACLEDALRLGDNHGIRGGLDPAERAKQFPQPPKRRRPAYPCNECGIGMGAPKSNRGAATPRYCSDACRAASKKRRQAEYDQRKREVAA